MKSLPTHEITQIAQWLGPIARRSLRATCSRLRAIITIEPMFAFDALYEEIGRFNYNDWRIDQVLKSRI